MTPRRRSISFLHLSVMIILCRSQTAAAQGNGRTDNRFVNPPAANSAANPVWVLGEQQTISWATTLTAYNISMWQQSLSQESGSMMANIFCTFRSASVPSRGRELTMKPKSEAQVEDKGVTNFTWMVQTYGFGLEHSPIFFFWINANTPKGFTSNYFNITDKARTTSASIFHTASSTSNPTTTSLSSTTSSPPTLTPQTPPPPSESGLDSTAKIALGVGIGVGLPALALLAALTGLKYRQSKKSKRPPPPIHLEYTTLPPRREAPASPPKEIHGTQVSEWCSELPDRRY
ncbi:hypothetical protein BDV28DRAFT_152082 [Aspergillus coremiiformis]|uniref:Mid2 domain-containing protein n=1 Tax=Aspergillus coremiiformis TaxID=138285 RepID=A0A5N6YX50_9EURO|nr:hypothetical protein BDV28DRAFT_152082 [Aspergillus coremiiformis]